MISEISDTKAETFSSTFSCFHIRCFSTKAPITSKAPGAAPQRPFGVAGCPAVLIHHPARSRFFLCHSFICRFTKFVSCDWKEGRVSTCSVILLSKYSTVLWYRSPHEKKVDPRSLTEFWTQRRHRLFSCYFKKAHVFFCSLTPCWLRIKGGKPAAFSRYFCHQLFGNRILKSLSSSQHGTAYPQNLFSSFTHLLR